MSRIISRRFLVLAMLEFSERFALSGVKSLLILTLIDRVLVGDLSQVFGATAAAALSARLFGPVSTTALASQLYGYANALLYIAVPLGGMVGDLLGRRGAMVLGSVIAMVAGLCLMLDQRLFLLGLIPFALGAGSLKGNLSAQVGLLFDDESARRRGYAIYLGFLNAGVICGPLACGALATWAGSRYAIAAAAIVVTICVMPYLRDGRMAEPAQAHADGRAPAPRRRGAVTLLVVALAATYLCFAAYEQLGDMFLVWARARVDLRLGTVDIPVAWFLSLDGVATLGLIGFTQWLFGAMERRGRRIAAIRHVMLGGACGALGYGVLALASAVAGEARVALPWTLLYLLLVDAAVVLVWPAGLSIVATLAPRRVLGTWTGIFYLHGFVASLWVGYSGVLYERMTMPSFWLLHAAIAAAGSLLVLLVGQPLWNAWHARQATITSA